MKVLQRGSDRLVLGRRAGVRLGFCLVVFSGIGLVGAIPDGMIAAVIAFLIILVPGIYSLFARETVVVDRVRGVLHVLVERHFLPGVRKRHEVDRLLPLADVTAVIVDEDRSGGTPMNRVLLRTADIEILLFSGSPLSLFPLSRRFTLAAATELADFLGLDCIDEVDTGSRIRARQTAGLVPPDWDRLARANRAREIAYYAIVFLLLIAIPVGVGVRITMKRQLAQFAGVSSSRLVREIDHALERGDCSRIIAALDVQNRYGQYVVGHDPSCGPVLIKCLEHEESEIRRRAARLLGIALSTAAMYEEEDRSFPIPGDTLEKLQCASEEDPSAEVKTEAALAIRISRGEAWPY